MYGGERASARDKKKKNKIAESYSVDFYVLLCFDENTIWFKLRAYDREWDVDREF